MTRKALLVAVGEYGEHAERLDGPEYELGQWQQLLATKPYKFDEVIPLLDPSLDTVIEKLETLLDGATDKDELLFVAMCHGMLVESSTEGEDEQALIMNPAGVGLEAAALRESRVKKIFRDKAPPKGTRIEFFVDSCYSGDYGSVMRLRKLARVGVVASAVPLFIPNDRDVRSRPIHAFGEFAEPRAPGEYEKPVILAATSPDGLAYEVTYDGIRRLVFTKHLLDALPQIHDTFTNVHEAIKYLDADIDQVASLSGNALRWNDKFPHPASPKVEGPDSVPEIKQETNPTVTEAVTASVNLRVLGIACFIDARGKIGAHKARIVLPYDNKEFIDHPNQQHFAWMEIATEDLAEPLQGSLAHLGCTYQRNGEQYTRWRLDGHTMSVQTADFETPFERSARFAAHVPKLIDVEPLLKTVPPDDSCFKEHPLLNRFAAFVNIAGGHVDVGSIDPRKITYKRSDGSSTLKDITTPRTVIVNIPVVSDYPTIVLRSYFHDKPVLTAKLQPGATVLIANARDIDITGNGAGNVPAKQFRQYYKVAIKETKDPPLPFTPLIPSDDCTVTDYP